MRNSLVIILLIIPTGIFAQWEALGNATFSNSSPHSMLVYGDSLIVGGNYVELNGDSCRGLTIWDGNAFHLFPIAPANRALALFDGKIVVGGGNLFSEVFGYNYAGAAYWDFENWYEMEGGAQWPNGDVQDLAVHDTLLIAVGGFDEIGTLENANTVAAWDGEHWISIGGVFGGFGNGAWNVISYQDKVYVSGGFGATDTPVQAVNNIAMWDGETWYPLGDGVSGYIQDMVGDPDSNALYVAGWFYEASSGAYVVAKWDGSNWSALTSYAQTLDSDVYCLTMYRGQLYCGGYFDGTNEGTEINKVARFDGYHWQPVAGSFGSGDEGVFDLEVFQDKLHACGTFAINGGPIRRQVASYYLDPDSVTWGVPDGIKELTQTHLSLKVYPNPNRGEFTIELDQPSHHHLLITDLQGRQLYFENLDGRQSAQVTLSNGLGTVLVSLVDGGKIIETTLVRIE